jgi:serine/threonine protein kinase
MGVAMAEPEVEQVAPDMVVSETMGGYDLLRRLGSGGMAEVHLARTNGIQGFQKLVVLKQILPHLSRDKHFVRMFIEEARVAALLDHPNVVQVFDLGREEGEFFFTMEFVYGENLQGLLKALQKLGQTLSVEHVVTLGIGVAAGLHYAHERVGFDGRPLGIVHRDVSPTNVMITYEGGVKVADFGIAKVITRTDVTRAGTRKGKVPYMSPEQCRAEKVDRRSDVFSLGVVLWEAVTGQRLFDGDNEFGVMNLIVNGQARPPTTVKPEIPKELERIIMRALTVDRDKRYQTARELQLDLEAFARELKVRATPSALGELMHYLFRPQPFPWGALRGTSGKAVMSPATIAEISKMLGSQGSIGTGIGTGFGTAFGTGVGTGVGTGAGTGAGSYGSQLFGTPATGASIGSMSASGTRAKKVDPRERTLRHVAIGLGSFAALALVLVLGLWLGGRGGADEVAEAKRAAADAAEKLAQAEAAAAQAAEAAPTIPVPPAAVAAPTEPAIVPTPTDAAPTDAAPTDAGPTDATPTDAAPTDAAPADAELEMVVEDDEPAAADGKASSPTKPKPSASPSPSPKPKTTKKKPDLDSFMPGLGG